MTWTLLAQFLLAFVVGYATVLTGIVVLTRHQNRRNP